MIAICILASYGLSLGVTSCKDDDNNENGGENMEQMESTGADLTMEEVQLSSLISNFSEVQADELLAQSGWQQKTYEVDFGVVLDESRPNVRSVEVGTLEAADEEACALLAQLGIDYQSPSGFQYSNGAVGTVSYQHGGGSDANTLAVINIDVKQLPGISQLQLVKQMPGNAGNAPRYHVGDIIRKQGDPRLYVCVRQASDTRGHAYFVSFWTKHGTGTCSWGHEEDVVYNNSKPMASRLSLGYWLTYFLMNDKGYNSLLAKLDKKGVKERVNDLIPATQEERAELIELLKTGPGRVDHREPLNQPEEMEKLKWTNTTKANGRIIAPRARLLCDVFRWKMGSSYQYWVPCLNWIDIDFQHEFKETVDAEPSQNVSSHFQWEMSPAWNAESTILANLFVPVKSYRVVCTAYYWQHKYYTLNGNSNQWAVFNFDKDWSMHPTQSKDFEDKGLWVSCNITSSELMIADKGEPVRGYEEVWVAAEDQELEDDNPDDASKIHKEEVKLYSIIGQDGHFYDNVAAAEKAGTTAMAIVTYLGETKRVERGQAWNGLAMALDKLDKNYQYTDDDHASEACQPAMFKGAQADKDFTGWATTQTLLTGCGKGHDHQAAKACNSHGDNLKLTARQTEFSSWFLPSFGQWVAAVTALGVKYSYKSDTEINFLGYGTMEKGFTDAGVPNLWEFLKNHGTTKLDYRTWTSTAVSADKAYSIQIATVWTINDFSNDWWVSKNYPQKVVPFIAFKYAGGGTIDQ